MPIPKKRKDEKKDDFVSRCMGDETMVKDYPDQKQRYAICIQQVDDPKDDKKDDDNNQDDNKASWEVDKFFE